MTKKVIKVRVGTPEIRKYPRGTGEYVNIVGTRTVYVDTSIDSLIRELQSIQKEYPEYDKLRLEEVEDCGCYNDCSCSPNHYVYGERLETDLEYDFRLMQEAKKTADYNNRDKAEYLRLKAKFEGHNNV